MGNQKKKKKENPALFILCLHTYDTVWNDCPYSYVCSSCVCPVCQVTALRRQVRPASGKVTRKVNLPEPVQDSSHRPPSGRMYSSGNAAPNGTRWVCVAQCFQRGQCGMASKDRAVLYIQGSSPLTSVCLCTFFSLWWTDINTDSFTPFEILASLFTASLNVHRCVE